MRLLQKGIQPLIVERERFPRFHIGESMTGECGRLLRELGLGDRMADLTAPVKHGVNVFGAKGHNDWWVPMMQRTPAGDLAPQADWSERGAAASTR